MFYAQRDGQRVRPEISGELANCPLCNKEVRAKCGEVITWHWAHLVHDCDTFSEPMTLWHRAWQEQVPEHCREFPLKKHRADIFAPNGKVVELQHSSISAEQVRARELFYQDMVWVFDVQEAYRGQTVVYDDGYYERSDPRIDLRSSKTNSNPSYRTFRWKHPKKSIGSCTKPVFLDLDGTQLLALGDIHLDAPCGGWGHLIPKDTFCS